MDTLLLTWINDWQHPSLTAGMSAVTWAGSIVFLLPLALVLGWRLGGGAGWRRRAFLPLAVLGAAIVVQVMKWLIDRDRPDLFPSLIPLPVDASFPSAHAWQVTTFVVAWLLMTGELRRYGQILAGILLVLLTGFSRLYLQVHFPSDVLFGILGGLLWVWALHKLPVWKRT